MHRLKLGKDRSVTLQQLKMINLYTKNKIPLTKEYTIVSAANSQATLDIKFYGWLISNEDSFDIHPGILGAYCYKDESKNAMFNYVMIIFELLFRNIISIYEDAKFSPNEIDGLNDYLFDLFEKEFIRIFNIYWYNENSYILKDTDKCMLDKFTELQRA